jgi:hypothetical protein
MSSFFGHRDAKSERRQLARQRRIDVFLQVVPKLSREVHVETGEVPDRIGVQLSCERGNTVDVIDVDGVVGSTPTCAARASSSCRQQANVGYGRSSSHSE